MEEMTVTGVVTQFPSTKSEQDDFVERLINEVTCGYGDPLRIEVQMANIEQVVKKYRSDPRIKECVLREAEKYGQKSFDEHHATFQIKETSSYNYDEAGHPRYNLVCGEIKRLNEERKELESIMRAQRNTWVYVDTETGEASDVCPLCRESSTIVSVTIKK